MKLGSTPSSSQTMCPSLSLFGANPPNLLIECPRWEMFVDWISYASRNAQVPEMTRLHIKSQLKTTTFTNQLTIHFIIHIQLVYILLDFIWIDSQISDSPLHDLLELQPSLPSHPKKKTATCRNSSATIAMSISRTTLCRCANLTMLVVTI